MQCLMYCRNCGQVFFMTFPHPTTNRGICPATAAGHEFEQLSSALTYPPETCKRCFGRGALYMGTQALLVYCPDCNPRGNKPTNGIPGTPTRIHSGARPIWNHVCDDWTCGCHKPECLGIQYKSSQFCNCGNDYNAGYR